MDRLYLEELLLNVFREDISVNKEMTFISQLAIIMTKSLLPSQFSVGNKIDYKRFNEELKLWGNYRVGDNQPLLNSIDKFDSYIYFNKKDNSIFFRIIPIIISNLDYSIIEDEVINNVLYTTGDIESLLEALVVSRLIFRSFETKDEIVEDLKSYIIGLSIIDYLGRYETKYKDSITNYPGNFKICFEKERINLLNLLNGISTNKYSVFEDMLSTLTGSLPETIEGKIFANSFKKGTKVDSFGLFYLNLSDYLLKLRKGRIDPEALGINEYILPDIFSFNTNDIFFHTLLRESRVIKKEVRNNYLTSLIQTKTGVYVFKKRDPI